MMVTPPQAIISEVLAKGISIDSDGFPNLKTINIEDVEDMSAEVLRHGDLRSLVRIWELAMV